jgi:hypothetical protein
LRLLAGDLTGSAMVRRLRLAPLSRQAAAVLAGPHGVDPGALYETTGGNPFFVTEVLAAGDEAIPATVTDAVAGPGGPAVPTGHSGAGRRRGDGATGRALAAGRGRRGVIGPGG